MDVQTLVDLAGGVGKLAARLGVKHNTVSEWKSANAVPASRVAQIGTEFALPPEDVIDLLNRSREAA